MPKKVDVYGRYMRSLLNRASDELFIIIVSFILILLVQYVWVVKYSGACLDKDYASFREQYLEEIFREDTVRTILSSTASDLGSELTLVRLYTQDYDYLIEYATSDKTRAKDASLVPVAGDVFFEDSYEDHQFQRCHIEGADTIENPLILSILGDSRVLGSLISCPLIDGNNFLMGAVSAYFESTPTTENKKTDRNVNFEGAENARSKLKVYALSIQEAIES